MKRIYCFDYHVIIAAMDKKMLANEVCLYVKGLFIPCFFVNLLFKSYCYR